MNKLYESLLFELNDICLKYDVFYKLSTSSFSPAPPFWVVSIGGGGEHLGFTILFRLDGYVDVQNHSRHEWSFTDKNKYEFGKLKQIFFPFLFEEAEILVLAISKKKIKLLSFVMEEIANRSWRIQEELAEKEMEGK